MKRNKNAKARTILKTDLAKSGEKVFSLLTTTPTMLDDQLINEQHKSISRKNNFSSSFHPSSESYPILPSIANMLTKKEQSLHRKNSSDSVAYSHPIPPSPIAGVYPEVCRTITV